MMGRNDDVLLPNGVLKGPMSSVSPFSRSIWWWSSAWCLVECWAVLASTSSSLWFCGGSYCLWNVPGSLWEVYTYIFDMSCNIILTLRVRVERAPIWRTFCSVVIGFLSLSLVGICTSQLSTVFDGLGVRLYHLPISSLNIFYSAPVTPTSTTPTTYSSTNDNVGRHLEALTNWSKVSGAFTSISLHLLSQRLVSKFCSSTRMAK